MTHADACRIAMLIASDFGCGMVCQRVVGLFYDAQDTPRILGIPGEADVQAVAPDGRAVGIEIKTGKARRRQNQKDWAAAFVRLGGLYCCAYFKPGEDGAETIKNAFRLAGYKEIRANAESMRVHRKSRTRSRDPIDAERPESVQSIARRL